MNYPLTFIRSVEGWAASCPSLPGCHTQGETRAEALTNLRTAIRLWLEVQGEEDTRLNRLAARKEHGPLIPFPEVKRRLQNRRQRRRVR
jgi:predicted RNase H-like HicB family nuclease